MKTSKKVLSIILAIMMVISIIPLTASAATYSGTCGDNLTWTYNTSTGTLTISGAGAMYDYKWNNRPWESYEHDIKKVVINNGVTTIGNYAFRNCTSLTSVTIGDSVTTIGNSAFSGCQNLTSVTIGDSVTIIGERAFYFCDSLTSVTIPDSVTTIGEGAFEYCESLTSVTIPDSVTTIGNYAFRNCTSLTSITISDSVTTIGDDAFSVCIKLTNIEVDKNNHYYSSDEYGALFNKDKTTLIQYPIGNTRTSYTIPDSVTTIGDAAFEDCYSLTSVTIPDGVTIIGLEAFCFCTNLTSVTIPDSVTTIDGWAFSQCTRLTGITIPDSVTAIGYGAFEFCESLTSITIPNGVTEIKDDTFAACVELKTVTIPNGVTTIGDSAFSNCFSLTSVTIPDSVTTIGDSAFEECDSLTDVYYSGTEEQWNAIEIGDYYNDSLLNATIHFISCEHKFSEWIVETSPTCTGNGFEKQVCSECGKTERRSVPATGHVNTTEERVEATFTSTGYVKVTCACGEVVSEKVLPIKTLVNSWKNQVRFQKNADGSYANKFDIRTIAVINGEDFMAAFGSEEGAVKMIDEIGFVYAKASKVSADEFSMDAVKDIVENGAAIGEGTPYAGYANAPVSAISTSLCPGDYAFTCLVKNIPDSAKTDSLIAVAYVTWDSDNDGKADSYAYYNAEQVISFKAAFAAQFDANFPNR